MKTIFSFVTVIVATLALSSSAMAQTQTTQAQVLNPTAGPSKTAQPPAAMPAPTVKPAPIERIIALPPTLNASKGTQTTTVTVQPAATPLMPIIASPQAPPPVVTKPSSSDEK